MASNGLKWPQNARILKNLVYFTKKTIFFKKVVFENFPKNSASIEKLHLIELMAHVFDILAVASATNHICDVIKDTLMYFFKNRKPSLKI